jgi:hypothetical protein
MARSAHVWAHQLGRFLGQRGRGHRRPNAAGTKQTSNGAATEQRGIEPKHHQRHAANPDQRQRSAIGRSAKSHSAKPMNRSERGARGRPATPGGTFRCENTRGRAASASMPARTMAQIWSASRGFPRPTMRGERLFLIRSR